MGGKKKKSDEIAAQSEIWWHAGNLIVFWATFGFIGRLRALRASPYCRLRRNQRKIAVLGPFSPNYRLKTFWGFITGVFLLSWQFRCQFYDFWAFKASDSTFGCCLLDFKVENSFKLSPHPNIPCIHTLCMKF